MDTPSVKSAILARLAELRAEIGALEARSSRISTLRGVSFLAAVGFGGARLFGPVPPLVWALSGAFALAFVALVVVHVVLVTRAAALSVRVGLVERGQKRIAGDFAGFPERGERFLAARHAYAADLDVFGPASLFQLVSTAETGPGEEALARWLSTPADAEEVAARQEAARELAGMPRFREDLAAAGVAAGTKGRGADPLLAWAEARADLSTLLVRVGQALVLVTVGLLIALEIMGSEKMGLLRHAWVATLVVQIGVLFALRPAIENILSIVASPEAPFARYVAILRLVEGQHFESARLVALRKKLCEPLASREIARLERAVSFAEPNGMIHVLLVLFLLWDVWCASALSAWRAQSGASVRVWITAIAEMEALASLGTFAYEHPEWAFPRVGEGELRFEADGLGHPLIPPSRRVDNDVALPSSGAALMITGSNMSGKSTLLRAIGINAVLALAGAPVCARRLEMTECDVRTSMRIKDSLEESVSHFYAELDRLKGIVDVANDGARVLFLLDELLHGTNSRERQIGAKAVVLHLLGMGSIGAVSSHDLGLADLAGESAGRVRNVHFQELVADGEMTFDYKLKEGVVTSANALRLMKVIGIAVDLPDA